MAPEAYTINQFCETHGISRAHYFNIKRQGIGPREMRVGTRVLISREACAEWRRERETASA